MNKRQVNEDEDDLQSLRIAALKSLSTNKDTVESRSTKSYKNIEVISCSAGTVLPSSRASILNLSKVNSRLGPVNSEPFVPICVESTAKPPQWGHRPVNFPSYVSGQIRSESSSWTDIQLSPRSAAFVSENNDILMRRKCEGSPSDNRNYRPPQARWTPNETSPERYLSKQRRSYSRSLSPQRRILHSPKRKLAPTEAIRTSPPPLKRRTLSRSPIRKRYNSRSPIPPQKRHVSPKSPKRPAPAPYRHSSRSPYRNRRISPPVVRPNKNRRNQQPPTLKRPVQRRPSPTPVKANGKANNDFNGRRRPSPDRLSRRFDSNRSPLKRSSQSPGKKTEIKRNRRPSHESHRKMSTNKRSLNASKEKTQRKQKEPPSEQSHTKSGHKPAEVGFKSSEAQFEKHREEAIMSSAFVTTQEASNEASNDFKESEERSSESESESNGDEIDLFPSDDSESENEGRFKSRSSSNRHHNKNVTTLSFTQLTSGASIKDNPKQTDSRTANSKDYHHRTDGDSTRRKSSGSGKNSIRNSRWPRNGGENSSSRSDSRRAKDQKPLSSDETIKFKSTFQSIESEPVHSLASGIVSSGHKTDKTNVLEFKKKIHEKLPIAAGESESTSGAKANAKKPIHLRLGDIAGTSMDTTTGKQSHSSSTGELNHVNLKLSSSGKLKSKKSSSSSAWKSSSEKV